MEAVSNNNSWKSNIAKIIGTTTTNLLSKTEHLRIEELNPFRKAVDLKKTEFIAHN